MLYLGLPIENGGFSHDYVNVYPMVFMLVQGGWSFNEVEPQTAGSLFLVPQIFCPNLGLSMDKHEQMLWLDSGEPLNYTLSIGVIFSENYLQSCDNDSCPSRNNKNQKHKRKHQRFSTWYGFKAFFGSELPTRQLSGSFSVNLVSTIQFLGVLRPRTQLVIVWIEQVSFSSLSYWRARYGFKFKSIYNLRISEDFSDFPKFEMSLKNSLAAEPY